MKSLRVPILFYKKRSTVTSFIRIPHHSNSGSVYPAGISTGRATSNSVQYTFTSVHYPQDPVKLPQSCVVHVIETDSSVARDTIDPKAGFYRCFRSNWLACTFREAESCSHPKAGFRAFADRNIRLDRFPILPFPGDIAPVTYAMITFRRHSIAVGN